MKPRTIDKSGGIDQRRCLLVLYHQTFIGHTGSAIATAVGKIVTNVPPTY